MIYFFLTFFALLCVFSIMTGHLLRIKVSTRGPKSYSLKVLEEFTHDFKANFPNVPIKDRVTASIPHLDYESLMAGVQNPADHTPELHEVYKLGDELTEELLSASHIVIATPMHNWCMPSSLKAWIDRVINYKTFYVGTKPLKGIPVTIIISSGGMYTEGPRHHMDHLRPWIKECLQQMGSEEADIRFVDCEFAGAMDAGRTPVEDPSSGFMKAKAQVGDAARRLAGV